ncbi:MarR family winged helix-turn-helix transcriptional regulator [Alkaliphilus serpentinus]|uniref:Winged helix DNA-binding protein n=1 Tax=Alkaliphilus serpentinus TaxID=1482731 RepID=A0A833M9B0_9FIRM|nr:MarR family transcriptional regulator [Alkaliphilus serpentinus]KAB3529321.1 winged helix DNA-binding protein [Alkaliphilus serpentinus]
MKENIVASADAMAMFCRLQMSTRKDLPIRSSEMGVLIYIQKEREAVTPLMISSFFHITKPSVTAMLNSLIRGGYLEKKQSSTDGRSYTVSITDKGLELLDLTYRDYFKAMELLEERMGGRDFDKLVNLIQKANAILKEEIK